MNFILQNIDWWEGNGKINDSLNVSYQAKVGPKTQIFLSEFNITIKIWMKLMKQIKMNKVGKHFNKMLIRNCVAQKLGFLIVAVNIFYDFETFSNSSNFRICFQIFLKFRDDAVDYENVSCHVYVNMGYVWIR